MVKLSPLTLENLRLSVLVSAHVNRNMTCLVSPKTFSVSHVYLTPTPRGCLVEYKIKKGQSWPHFGFFDFHRFID